MSSKQHTNQPPATRTIKEIKLKGALPNGAVWCDKGNYTVTRDAELGGFEIANDKGAWWVHASGVEWIVFEGK